MAAVLAAMAAVALVPACGARYAGTAGRAATHAYGTADTTPVGDIATPVALLEESFDADRHGWDGASQRVEHGQYVWHVAAGRSIHSARDLVALGAGIDDVTVDATFTQSGAGLVGINCANVGHFAGGAGYVLGLSPAGAVITKQMPMGTAEQVLARNDRVRLSEAPTLLTARCHLTASGYELELQVDHRSAVEAVDHEPLGAGAPGLVVGAGGSGAASRRATARFTHFQASVPDDGPEL